MMKTTLDPKQAKDWFGAAPPDLSVIARSRAEVGKGTGADYLYTLPAHLLPRRHASRPAGTTSPFPTSPCRTRCGSCRASGAPGSSRRKTRTRKARPNAASPASSRSRPARSAISQYDEAVGDLVAYLQWMGEPAQGTRVRIGVGVLIFLGLLIVITWRLNAAFWRSVN